jgi:7-carboxy-7-deazaguanine synthase
MFGQNILAKANYDLKGSLNVNSIFSTIQGEGPFSGVPALFIRLQGCSLRCFWCDTEFDSGITYRLDKLEDYVYKHSPASVAFCNKRPLIVITGGEPLLQADLPVFVKKLIDNNYRIQIETSGTVWQPGFDVLVDDKNYGDHITFVVSPKTGDLHSRIYRVADCFKYIIKSGEVGVDGLPNTSTQTKGKSKILARPAFNTPVYVMPLDEQDNIKNAENLREAAKSSMNFGYILCMQVHKLAGLE